ncbi:nitrous oxide reductase family maturation protein NosD [Haloarchaeobius sp. TZWSO28]|uniref:nitrous oxide reductase family maturation protein NosD n=1 Tax=Haloarchaeobius sp. TZWSO28 TaxID=3446119 RepID=UPI003EBC091A
MTVREVREYGIVAVALVVVLAAAGIAVAGPAASAASTADASAGSSSSDAGRQVAFDPSVPRELAFEAPTEDGVARLDGQEFDTLRAALDAADPGDVVRVEGRFDETVTVTTPNVTIRGAGPDRALLHGDGEGDVLTIGAPNVTVAGVWVRNSGWQTSGNDAAIWVDGRGVTVRDSRVTNTTFGVWVNGTEDVRVLDNTIVGRESVESLTDRGNGIQLWRATGAVVRDNRITDVRDGVYYSWASEVVATGNTMWDLRYGVHYMYSDHCVLRNNTAFGNDAGYALMISEYLRIENNTAVNNAGQSGHGIMVKSIDHSVLRGNEVVGNGQGLFVYNSLNNTITHNLVMENQVGVHLSAGSVRERVHHNSFVENDRPVKAVVGEQVAWNSSREGNYWSSATTADTDQDGVSETRYQPAGLVEHLVAQHPEAAVFADSPAFAVVRTAERSVPVIEAPGVVDQHALVRPPHDNWRRYYDDDD